MYKVKCFKLQCHLRTFQNSALASLINCLLVKSIFQHFEGTFSRFAKMDGEKCFQCLLVPIPLISHNAVGRSFLSKLEVTYGVLLLLHIFAN